MLIADKHALETNLQVSLLKIREKELQFYTQNCIAIGTQAALLSGFAYNGIIQVDIPTDQSDWLKTLYLCVTTAAMGFELIAVLNSTLCSMLGPGLALRGPDGSMHRAVDGLMLEYRLTFLFFTAGLVPFWGGGAAPASRGLAYGRTRTAAYRRLYDCFCSWSGHVPHLGAALCLARVLVARRARNDARAPHVYLRDVQV